MTILYSYYRSSCSFRVRIALKLKKIDCEFCYINLNPSVSQQLGDDFRAINPQARVPYFIDGEVRLSQSSAIIEYLEEKYPEPPLLPTSITERANVRQLVSIISADIQPLNNLAVLSALKSDFKADDKSISHWYAHWIQRGFSAVEALLCGQKHNDAFYMGGKPGLVEIFLIPQVWNALRFEVDVTPYPKIWQLYQDCLKLEAFQAAAPEAQADAS